MNQSSEQRCPRCSGLLVRDPDPYSEGLCCLLCGYHQYRVQADPITEVLDASGRRTGARAGRRRTKDYSGGD